MEAGVRLRAIEIDIVVVFPASGRLGEDDILILPLDVVDTATHAAATQTVLKKFGQVCSTFEFEIV